MIHSCGDVDELFDDLIAAGLNCFNPFQPEVMDVDQLLPRYRGRLAFYGGLSTQRTLPFGTVSDVRAEVAPAAEVGRRGRLHFRPGPRRGGRRPLGKHAGGHRGCAAAAGLQIAAVRLPGFATSHHGVHSPCCWARYIFRK